MAQISSRSSPLISICTSRKNRTHADRDDEPILCRGVLDFPTNLHLFRLFHALTISKFHLGLVTIRPRYFPSKNGSSRSFLPSSAG